MDEHLIQLIEKNISTNQKLVDSLNDTKETMKEIFKTLDTIRQSDAAVGVKIDSILVACSNGKESSYMKFSRWLIWILLGAVLIMAGVNIADILQLLGGPK